MEVWNFFCREKWHQVCLKFKEAYRQGAFRALLYEWLNSLRCLWRNADYDYDNFPKGLEKVLGGGLPACNGWYIGQRRSFCGLTRQYTVALCSPAVPHPSQKQCTGSLFRQGMHCKGRSDWADLGVEPILAFFFHNQAPPVCPCFLPKSFGMAEAWTHWVRLF